MKTRHLWFLLAITLFVVAIVGWRWWGQGAFFPPKSLATQNSITGATLAEPGFATAPRDLVLREGVFSPLSPPIGLGDLTLIAEDGNVANLQAYRTKNLLINLWATWCAPCVDELPSLAALQRKLGGAKFAVLPISIDEGDPALVAAFLKRHGIDLPAYSDLNREMDNLLRIRVVPISLLVDRQGKIQAAFAGDTRWDCGQPLKIVTDFVENGVIGKEMLEPCP